MAYCLRSFIETLDQVLNPHKHHQKWVLDNDKKPQIQSLYENATFLQEFLDESSPEIQERISSVEDMMMKAAEKAKIILESYISDQVLLNPEGQRFTISPPDLSEVMQVFEEFNNAAAGQPSDDFVVSSTRYPYSKNEVIGMDDLVKQLKERLRKRSSKFDIISIVGIGGDQTTLARLLYDDPSCRNYFELFGWATVSENSDKYQILGTLISSVTGNTPPQQIDFYFKEILHRKLYNRRYLIVIDGIWSCKVWDDVKGAFPDDVKSAFPEYDEGGWIICTTRDSSVAHYISPHCIGMHLLNDIGMHLLNDESSPELLMEKRFEVAKEEFNVSRNEVIGLNSDVAQLMDQLYGFPDTLKIISIVGMGGIGKTTLARQIYHHPSYCQHFDCFGWVTVSESCDRNENLETLISSVTGKTPPRHIDNDSLRETLHRFLYGRRYLIVIDDIRSFKAWDGLNISFPDNNNRNRIICTTRDNSLAHYISPYCHEMHLLNNEDSWVLLRKEVFGRGSCPLELEEVGKRIAMNCQGLPLAIQVVGGLLSQFQMSRSMWEYVEHNKSRFVADFHDQFSGLWRSFTQLPHYLKPCLLYISTFLIDQDIEASKIIKLLVAEEFLKPIGGRSLEEVAEVSLNDLVDRSLIFVRRKKNGKAKSYGMHAVLRELCLREVREKKFLYVKGSQTDILQDDKLCLRLVSGHPPIDDSITLKLASRTHSYLLIGNAKKYKLEHCVCFKPSLLHVLDVYQVKVNEFPEAFLQLVNLRYLAIYTKPGEIHRSIYLLTNLQTLIVKYLMSSIALVLALPKLRHLEFDDLIRTNESRHDILISPHESLQSLCNIPLEILAENLLGKLPKLRKLGIKCGYYIYSVDLTCFQELETLKCYNGFYLANGNFISNISFPNSLNTLTLYCCGVPDLLLIEISMLPNLRVLKLDECIFMTAYWEPIEDKFFSLQYLRISGARNLKELRAGSEHFPSLEHLVLRNCPDLHDIPWELGDSPNLIMIEVDECKASVFDSARRIQEEQQDYGNDDLQLRLGSAIE